MPDFGDDAIYVWAITILGLATPVLMTGLVLLRIRLAKRRLDRLSASKDET